MQAHAAPQVAIIGGGAAGFFAAITCAQANPQAHATLYEATAQPLSKVRISGGGRCNVTHACYDPRELVRHYPRGARELLGAFHRWQPHDMVAWFEAHGVPLKAEPDGRIFPVSDDSYDIVACLRRTAAEAGVALRLRTGIRHVEHNTRIEGDSHKWDAPQFRLTLSNGEHEACDRLLIATGGSRTTESGGLKIASGLGHSIELPVPSLFTFHSDDTLLSDLAGLSVEAVALSVVGSERDAKHLTSEGPLLITHWGLSGPAILKLSAWGARTFAACDYRFRLRVNFVPTHKDAAVELSASRTASPRRSVARAGNPFGLPARLWERLVSRSGISSTQSWGELSNARLAALAETLRAAEFRVCGKSTNKDEFVTCGGVSLREVDFRTMQSRVCPGLYFAGEVLNIDGVTGGFNFQAAWTTGYLSGLAMAT